MAKYLSCGNIMSDCIETADGIRGDFHLGGPAIFGAEGIKLWDDDCGMVCHAGFDWEATYGKWLEINNISKDYVTVLPYETSRCLMQHRPDGSYKWIPLQGREHIDRMDLTAQAVLRAVDSDTKGLYHYMYYFDDFYRHVPDIRQKAPNMKIMWEFGIDRKNEGDTDVLKEISHADMFSLNSFEAEYIFAIPREKTMDIIDRLQQLPVEFTFFRVGQNGAYGITKDEVWHCPAVNIGPSVDSSGCGNCSTAAAMYGWLEYHNIPMAIATACVSAGYNAAQYGVWPKFTQQDRQNAVLLREKVIKELVKRIK